ncbi:peroxiredoxin [Mobilicoccus pelagius]|uniref:Putative peroxiredoxin n=1 Tax=Mobilicoccus pelagius NBRC 104925 TaxID=1089455 RepID=H5UQ11_9MICO|nr:peroxiredoxin [Mobilicoccus pelagius]GAB47816.1 putative peroxiredoxin [Mobilicoccus pelagius NBRC 104925]
MTPLSIGDAAPAFALTNQFGKVVTLEELTADRAALLVFYPFAFSGICTGELQAIRDDLARFQSEHVTTVAISCDPMFTLRAWADSDAFFFPLLSDFWPHGQVARSYGVFEEEGGFATRGTFLVVPDGTIAWTLVTGPGEQRDFSGFHRTLADLVGA